MRAALTVAGVHQLASQQNKMMMNNHGGSESESVAVARYSFFVSRGAEERGGRWTLTRVRAHVLVWRLVILCTVYLPGEEFSGWIEDQWKKGGALRRVL
jgi:hypothetical protein